MSDLDSASISIVRFSGLDNLRINKESYLDSATISRVRISGLESFRINKELCDLVCVTVSKARICGLGSIRTNKDRVNNNNNNNNDNNDNNNRIQRRYSRFFTISSLRRELSPTRTHKWPGRNRVQTMCNTSSAYHVQVSYYVPHGTKGQLRY